MVGSMPSQCFIAIWLWAFWSFPADFSSKVAPESNAFRNANLGYCFAHNHLILVNADLQHYSGETTMSYFSQIAALGF
jgi:K+-transporting ATPase A subunit